MESSRPLQRVAFLLLAWAAIFTTLSIVRYIIAENVGKLEPSVLFTGTDALIAAAPVVVWLLVVIDWEKFSVGPLAFERRMRRRISDGLNPRAVQPVRIEDLDKEKVEEIRSSETNAVRVVVGRQDQSERYENLLYFVGEGGRENIDWRHVQYLFFTNGEGRLVGTMGPGRFRNKLVRGGRAFLRALQTNDAGKFLDYGDEIQVRRTDSKSRVLQMFAEYQLQWFPVVDESGRPIGIIEPGRLAVSVLADIAEVLGGR